MCVSIYWSTSLFLLFSLPFSLIYSPFLIFFTFHLFSCNSNNSYVQHPVAVKAVGGERAEVPLPMYLTKKERKRIRKTAREEREREKRDKMMMGLLPAPEPKFKLSNFMKVLGDQAVAGTENFLILEFYFIYRLYLPNSFIYLFLFHSDVSKLVYFCFLNVENIRLLSKCNKCSADLV